MKAEYGHFPSDWSKMPGTPAEYRKMVGALEMRATEKEGVCEKCGKRGLGFLYRTLDSNGYEMENSEVYWCPECGEGMNPEAYAKFVRIELLEGGT